jgi:sugar phosphate isomerase/epimerase
VAGELPFPDGYRRIPPDLIAHVHAKDCRMENGAPAWLPLGEGVVDWNGQFAALAADGYRGWISLETHWPGPGGDKLQGSIICARNLKRLAAESEERLTGVTVPRPPGSGQPVQHMCRTPTANGKR